MGKRTITVCDHCDEEIKDDLTLYPKKNKNFKSREREDF
jgi:hypothetical protein